MLWAEQSRQQRDTGSDNRVVGGLRLSCKSRKAARCPTAKEVTEQFKRAAREAEVER